MIEASYENYYEACVVSWLVSIFLYESTTDQVMVINPNASASLYSFLSLGDSYTIGESVSAYRPLECSIGGYASESGAGRGRPRHHCRTGWTTAELQNTINSSGNQKKYTLVSLMIGVNNQYRGQSQDRYRTEFKSLLQTAINFANGKADHVLCCLPPIGDVHPSQLRRTKLRLGYRLTSSTLLQRRSARRLVSLLSTLHLPPGQPPAMSLSLPVMGCIIQVSR